MSCVSKPGGETMHEYFSRFQPICGGKWSHDQLPNGPTTTPPYEKDVQS